MKVLLMRKGKLPCGTEVSDVFVRGADNINIENINAVFEAARYALLDSVSDEQITQMTSLIDEWEPGVPLRPNQLVTHQGIVYRVQQGHVSQADWSPEVSPSLFRALGSEDEASSKWPQWVQPTGSHDAYSKGDRVTYNGIRFESEVDNNVWAPSVWGWRQAV